MATFVTLTNAGKGKPFRLSQSIDNNNNNLKIGIKIIFGYVGFYNIDEELEWRYTHQGEAPSDAILIEPGLYNFGKINMSIPEEYQIAFPDRVLKSFGLDDSGSLNSGEYIGDHAVEFMPQRISVYLNQLSSTNNLESTSSGMLEGCQLLGWVPLSNASFGEYFATTYDKPSFKLLQNAVIHELDLDFKIEWKHFSKKIR